MSKVLDDQKNYKKILKLALDESYDYLENVDKRKVAPKLEEFEDLTISKEGLGVKKALEVFKEKYKDYLIASNGPRYFGFVVGGATPASIVGDWLTSVYDQCALGLQGNIDYYLEKETINLLKFLFNLDDDFHGNFVTGATMANFVALSLARQWVGKKRGINMAQEGLYGIKNIKVISSCPHSSIYKSLSMLGLGRNIVEIIDGLENREAIDVNALENYLNENKESEIILVANAGTVNTTDFDDLEAIAKLRRKYNFWLHVDAAFGGIALCSEKYNYLMEGINNADSITIDNHKWLNVPYDSAVIFTKHEVLQSEVFYNGASYLDNDNSEQPIFNMTPENSRRMRALSVWMGLVAYGKNGYQEIIERNCEVARKLERKIEKEDRFELLAKNKLNVVCFTLNINNLTKESINKYLEVIRDEGEIFLTSTIYNGKPGIRVAVSNWQTTLEDLDIIWNSINNAYEAVN